MAAIIRREIPIRPQAFSFADVERRADEVLAEARRDAAAVVAEARRQAESAIEKMKQEAYAQGLEEGRAAGRKQIEAEARETVLVETRARFAALGETLQRLGQTLEQRKHNLLAQAESGLIAVAARIAERVCKISALRSSEPVIQNVRALLDAVRHEADVVVELHPEDIEHIRGVLPALVESTRQLEHVALAPVEEVGRGGCRVRTRHGAIDASLDTQIERIAEALCLPQIAAAGEPPADIEAAE